MRFWLVIAAAIAMAACAKSSKDAADQLALEAGAVSMDEDDDFELEDAEDDPNSTGDDASAGRGMGAASEPPSGPARGDVVRLVPQVILDATGFAEPMAAATIFVPHGWRIDGGVFWDSQFTCTNGYNFIWTATAPDQLSSIAIAPQMAWEMNTMGAPPSRPGCEPMQIQSVRDYLQATAPRMIEGARILDYRDRPDLVSETGFQASTTPMPMGEIRRWAEGGEIRFAFSRNGRAMHGAMAAVVQFDHNVTDMSAVSGVGSRTEYLSAFAHPGWVATAPDGEFSFAFFEAIRKSIKANPQWARAISGHNGAIARVSIEESRKRASAVQEANDYISKLRQETWSAQQESADRRFREFGEVLRGVETYKDDDAPGGQQELSGHYAHAWRLNDGTYVMTDDSNFDPWRDLRLEGKKLEAAQ